jgi:aldose sugar dehydrogenase
MERIEMIVREWKSLLMLIAAALSACESGPGRAQHAETAAGGSASCRPLESREPNASGQEPAFPGQTRACGAESEVPFRVRVLATGLLSPWAVEPLPDGSLLVTEKAGMMRIVSASGAVGRAIVGVPDVDADGQGGLLDVALSPSFATDRTLFWSYTEPREDGNGTSVARGVLSPDRSRLEQVRVILRTRPSFGNGAHFGSRLVFGRDGTLFVTMGERSSPQTRGQAQRLDSHFGKTLRIRPDGSIPADNPFRGRAGALPEIWSYGHRNIQAATLDPQGRLWTIEHGPRGGDELNLVERGKNYGWPEVTYGEDYSGRPMGEGITRRPDVQQPVYYWDPVIAPSGAELYTGSAFPAWRGSLFVGALAQARLVRLILTNGRVTGEEHLLQGRGRRIRDVRQGPDGALYVVTDDRNGELWKLEPR